VKPSKNILENSLSLHADSTVPLNPGIMKAKVRVMASHISLLEDTNLLSLALLKTDLKTAKKNQEGERKKKREIKRSTSEKS